MEHVLDSLDEEHMQGLLARKSSCLGTLRVLDQMQETQRLDLMGEGARHQFISYEQYAEEGCEDTNPNLCTETQPEFFNDESKSVVSIEESRATETLRWSRPPHEEDMLNGARDARNTRNSRVLHR